MSLKVLNVVVTVSKSQNKLQLEISIVELGNNKYSITIESSTYEVYAPNSDTAINKAMKLHSK